MAQSISNTTQNKVKWGVQTKPISSFSFNGVGPNTGLMSSATPAVGKLPPPKTTPALVTAPQTQTYQNNQPQQNYTPQQQTHQQMPSVTQTNSPSGGSIKGMVSAPKPSPFQNTFQGLIDASRASHTQEKILDELRQTASGNAEIGNRALETSKMYGDQIAKVGNLGAGAVAGDLSTGSNIVGSGNAAIASQSASSRMEALANAQNAALQGTQQQLTGQGQQANALNQALTGANTQQSQRISGLSSAASYAQPSPAGYGQTVFDPLTGSYGGGQGNLDPQTTANQLAQQVKSGQMTYEQAVSSLGYAGGAGQQFLNNALGGGFNAPQSTANIQGQANVVGNLPAMQSADIAAEGVKNKINTYLQQNTGLNVSDLAVGNKLQQWIEGKQLTDPKYQTLFNYLNEYTNTLAPILGVGGDPTNLKTEIAQSFINAAASGQSISEVLENMQSLSRGKIQDLRSGATGGGVVSSPQAGGGNTGGYAETW